ncbi:MAG TPA: helix-turn-helix domain-containing protein [Pyrinomonadaceae bacterium]|nr:helix-turn-helix domain-containing protein [Pyrinomonadaceae bacterium]
MRELRNVIERALILDEGEVITAKHLPPGVAAGSVRTRQNGAHAMADVDDLIHLPPGGVSIDDVEMSLVKQAMAQSGGVQKHAAALLGLSRDQLRYRLKKFTELRA